MESIIKFLKSIVEFFTNKNHSISKRMAWAIILLFLMASIVYLDYAIGFSQRIQTMNSIEDLTKVENLKSKVKHDTSLVKYLDSIEKGILSENHIYKRIGSFFHSEPSVTITTQKILAKEPKRINDSFNIWHLLTTSFFWVVVMIILPIMIISNKSQNSKAGIIASMIAAELVMLGIIWVFYYLLGLIPIINDTPTINYTINIVVQILILFLIYYIEKKLNKK